MPAAAALVVAVFGSVACATHATSRAEERAVIAAVEATQGNDADVDRVTVSTADPRYATVGYTYPTGAGPSPNYVDLYHLRRGTWTPLWGHDKGTSPDGACAYAPARVVRDLFEIGCPSDRALHAAKATPALERALRVALKESPWTTFPTAPSLWNPCLSRLDPRWAATKVDLGSVGGVVWFQRTHRWAVRYETVVIHGHLPPPAIVLSLASCVDYEASEYGG
jgi:hypothetical protein